MAVSKIRATTDELDRLLEKIDGMKRGPQLLIRDIRKLGDGGYKFLKSIIPMSKLRKPHLRNNFKITVNKIANGFLLSLTPHPESSFGYSVFLDQGALIPIRFPRTRKAMRFRIRGKTIFAKRAKGFVLKGIHYVDKGELWLQKNIGAFIDISLKSYL